MYPHTFRNERSVTETTSSVYGNFYFGKKVKKIPIDPVLVTLLQYIDSNVNCLKNNLAKAVEIKSVSNNALYSEESISAVKFAEKWLDKLGFKYECFDVGLYDIDGQEFRIPPIILATLVTCSKKPTLCVYSHLDVKTPDCEEWATDPFKLEEIDKRFYGAGTASGKGPLLIWFQVIELFHKLDIELPVNIKFVIESMHYNQHLNLEKLLSSKKTEFVEDVDYLVFNDSHWLGNRSPCIIYGCVGMLHFALTIEKNKDSPTDIATDMANIFSTIKDENNYIIVENFHEHVQQVTPDEEKIYDNVKDFEIDRELLPENMQNCSQSKILMDFWRFPSIHVEPLDQCEDGTKIEAHFIIKIVPKQIDTHIVELIKKHVVKQICELKIENKVSCELILSTRPWIENYHNHNYLSAQRAIIQIFKQNPILIREDKSRLIMNVLERVFEKNILNLPLVSKDSNRNRIDENISKRCYTEGMKLLAAYLFQLGNV